MNKLLLVEDNKSLAKMLSLHIKKKSEYEVMIAYSLQEALALLDRHQFLAALLDLNLPDAPNGEIVDVVLGRGVPSIVLTGNFDEETRQFIIKKPIVDYVYKEKLKDIDYIVEKIDRLDKNKDKKVLIVDDSKVVLNVMRDYLLRELYQVVAITNGKEALEYYIEHKDISLVVADFNMPVMNGLDLTIELRKLATKNDLSIIGVSSDLETASKFLKFGANDFIRKPFSKEEFICRVNNAVEALENIQKINNLALTLEKKVEEKVVELRAKDILLVKQSRQAIMGDMISNITHQLRQPISSMYMSIQDAEITASLGEIDVEYVTRISQDIKEQLEYMTKTIEDFRLYFRPNKEKKIFHISDAVKQTERLVKASLRSHGIELAVDVNEKIEAFGFENELVQVLLNKVKNAQDAISSNKVKNPFIAISTATKDKSVIIKIKDNGGGIPEDIIDKIFDSHFTTKSEDVGTGIGLYMSKMIVEDGMDGKITVYNEDGGAVFEICLPNCLKKNNI